MHLYRFPSNISTPNAEDSRLAIYQHKNSGSITRSAKLFTYSSNEIPYHFTRNNRNWRIMSDTTRSSDHSEISIMRSEDGKMFKVTVPLSTTTLNALKDVIHTHPDLGPIQRKHQRLFHLGRELKSGNRSLKALGVGKFSVFLIHLHSLAPKTFDLQSDDDNDDYNDYVRDDGISAGVGIGEKNGSKRGITNIDDDDDDDDVIEINGESTNANSQSEMNRNNQNRSNEEESGQNNAYPNTASSIHASRQPQQESEKVVELLDSDDEGDDDDDIEVVETLPTSHSKKRKYY